MKLRRLELSHRVEQPATQEVGEGRPRQDPVPLVGRPSTTRPAPIRSSVGTRCRPSKLRGCRSKGQPFSSTEPGGRTGQLERRAVGRQVDHRARLVVRAHRPAVDVNSAGGSSVITRNSSGDNHSDRDPGVATGLLTLRHTRSAARSPDASRSPAAAAEPGTARTPTMVRNGTSRMLTARGPVTSAAANRSLRWAAGLTGRRPAAGFGRSYGHG